LPIVDFRLLARIFDIRLRSEDWNPKLKFDAGHSRESGNPFAG
jgi:hypothetical protein